MVLTLAASLTVIQAAASPDLAYGCTGTLKCYSQADLKDSGEAFASGANDELDVGCVAVPEQESGKNFNTDELWVIIESAGSETWVEAGIITGYTFSAGDRPEPAFFIASQTGGKYIEEVGSEASTKALHEVDIWQASPAKSKNWYAATPGTGLIEVYGFPSERAAVELQTGLETSTGEGWNDAAVTAMEYQNSAGEYKTKWTVSGHGATLSRTTEKFYWDWETVNSSADFGFNNHGC